MDRRSAPARHAVRTFALLGLAAMALALAPCRPVRDRLTGVSLGSGSLSARSGCARACGEAWKSAVRDEEARHRSAVRACASRGDCRKAEAFVHRQNLQDLTQARRRCKSGCYNEGAGSAGR